MECVAMTNELLALCDHPIDDDAKKSLSMKKDFPKLFRLGQSRLIIPLQESLTATLPPSSSGISNGHQPFPTNTPTFQGMFISIYSQRIRYLLGVFWQDFYDEIDIMRSLAKPRKIGIMGSNGQTYTFLGKPKDDLRKDARLMDFNAIINKLLKANSESRRRQLRELHFCARRMILTTVRYSHIWGGNIKRGMRFHTMGAQHHSHPPSSS